LLRTVGVAFLKKNAPLTGFRHLGEAIVKELRLENAILDGELVATDGMGRAVFAALMQRSRPAVVKRHGSSLTPLAGTKDKLKRILPSRSAHLLYVEHTKGAGTRLSIVN
jgi:hypothetical protein